VFLDVYPILEARLLLFFCFSIITNANVAWEEWVGKTSFQEGRVGVGDAK
jgi:hypothetical protein